MRRAASYALTILLALSGCGDAKEGASGERKTAAGEVLGGSITDDMLPLDTVQSQSPPMRESSAGSSDDASDRVDAAKPAPTDTSSAEPSAAATASATPQAEN